MHKIDEKMFWKNEPESFKADLDIYKSNGDYDKSKIAKIAVEKINFIYENAITLMKEMDDDIKTISARSTSIFGYLTVIVLALAAFVFSEGTVTSNEEIIIEAAIVLSIIYIAISALIVWTLISPDSGYHAHSEPRKLLANKIFPHDIKLIKIREIEVLQGKIKRKGSLLARLRIWMTLYKGCLCLSLPVVIAWALLT